MFGSYGYPHRQLLRLHWEVVKPVALLYQQPGAKACKYRLVIFQYRKFGTPAAVQDLATEAWAAGPSAVQHRYPCCAHRYPCRI